MERSSIEEKVETVDFDDYNEQTQNDIINGLNEKNRRAYDVDEFLRMLGLSEECQNGENKHKIPKMKQQEEVRPKQRASVAKQRVSERTSKKRIAWA